GEKRLHSVARELRGVKSSGRQAAESFGHLFGSNRASLGRGLAAQQFRQQRRTRHRRNAPACPESRFGDSAGLDPGRKLENVPADWIFHGNGGCGGVQLAGIARVLEMVEYGFAIHWGMKGSF